MHQGAHSREHQKAPKTTKRRRREHQKAALHLVKTTKGTKVSGEVAHNREHPNVKMHQAETATGTKALGTGHREAQKRLVQKDC